jgi:outer membrane protein OmpA-like peptidoglycan-associated protein
MYAKTGDKFTYRYPTHDMSGKEDENVDNGSYKQLVMTNTFAEYEGNMRLYDTDDFEKIRVQSEYYNITNQDAWDKGMRYMEEPMSLGVAIDSFEVKTGTDGLIFYEYDKATLLPESKEALDKLVVMMEENPNITIELSSHCDYRGSDFYNERLAQRRAESVVNYMIEHGVAKDRLTAVGYGESRPKVVRRRLAAQHEFLTEGDTLTEAFIKKLPDEEKQEICNALNRRTEFRVLRTTYQMDLLPKS